MPPLISNERACNGRTSGFGTQRSRVHFNHDDVIKWKHFPRYWPCVRGIHRYPVNSAHKGQWRGALMFSLICAWINGWVNNREAGDLRRHQAHHDVIVMMSATQKMPYLRTYICVVLNYFIVFYMKIGLYCISMYLIYEFVLTLSINTLQLINPLWSNDAIWRSTEPWQTRG